MKIENTILQTVVETPEFIRQADKLLDEKTKNSFISYIAKDPCAGDIIQGTGGLRKIRWQGDLHRGKSGGVRIIYYYHDKNIPIFLLTLYKKSIKTDLSSTEKKILCNIMNNILEMYQR